MYLFEITRVDKRIQVQNYLKLRNSLGFYKVLVNLGYDADQRLRTKNIEVQFKSRRVARSSYSNSITYLSD